MQCARKNTVKAVQGMIIWNIVSQMNNGFNDYGNKTHFHLLLQLMLRYFNKKYDLPLNLLHYQKENKVEYLY